LTFTTVGVTAGALVTNEGTEPWVAILAGTLLFSVTAELAYLAVITGGGSSLAGVLSGWLVSSRFGLLAITLSQALGPDLSRRWKALAAFVVVDPTAAIANREDDPGAARRSYGVVSFWNSLGYMVGSAVGALLGSHIGDPGAIGFDAVFPAVLVSISMNALRHREAQVAGAIGFLVTVATVEVTPGGLPVLLALSGAVVAVLFVRPEPGET
jgi:branched chain amino acid efflux pump